MEIEQVKISENLLFFSRINVPRIVASLWIICRVLKKLILKMYASVLIIFMEEWISRGPSSIIPKVLLSQCVFLITMHIAFVVFDI